MLKKRFDVAWLRNINIAISISKQIKQRQESREQFVIYAGELKKKIEKKRAK